ncbi:hypothetical protein [Hydrogenimonas urashimensis]|uniref:hypothetical protein n=1 Tax=Hydrogenimonas urashimensis TaxID=2740515 RepID=UPI0019166BBF|nr:hypothetical protein [Hydrogenimonas urashimensis]
MHKAEKLFEKIEKVSYDAMEKETIAKDYRIAGHHVRLLFAGPALVPRITPALEHLACEKPDNPDLTVHLWDTASTGCSLPPVEWGPDDYLEHGLIRGYNTQNIATTFNLDSGTLNIFNTEKNLALFWVRDARTLPYYETGSPLRNAFFWWGIRKGLQYAHAAAIGTDEGAVLLVGKGGSGKSTSALSCLSHPDLFYIGDDYVLVQKDPVPVVHSLYNSAKLNADHAINFPHLLKHASNADRLDTEKALLFINEFQPQKLRKSLPLRAIVMPHVTGRPESGYDKASASAALRALAPSSMFQLPGSDRGTFAYFAQLVRKLPAYNLRAGTRYEEIPETILSILKEASHAG